jgi:pyruvate dehydrogenase E1 component alpha subunit/2-oxoisovalerate dehydrogenase E1 component alpha subunit
MSTFELKLPDIGEGVVEGEIVHWLVKEGDSVAEDQPLVEVMTDKATVVIPSPKAGRVLRRHGAEGSMARVHHPLVTLLLGASAAGVEQKAAPGHSPETFASRLVLASASQATQARAPSAPAPTSSPAVARVPPPPAVQLGRALHGEGSATLSPAQLLEVYQAMVRIRLLDERMMTLQRQGRIGFYGACTGQEAACLGSAYALHPSDWVFPALREAAAMLLRGMPLVPYISQLFGNSGDLLRGRQMPSHQAARAVNQVSWSSCIGTQLPQAVGAAYAAKVKRDGRVVMAYMGDGATSSPDFHAAMNFAGVYRAPVVFLCQNNHWSISVRVDRQTASESIAIKAKAYGFPGVQVDGNDVEAVYAATAAAVARARAGEGPTLIEALTYRIGAHSSSDDPTRYRDSKEVEQWVARDPLKRAFERLTALGQWDTPRDEALRETLRSEIHAATQAAEAQPMLPAESLFDDVYSQEPWHLAEQRRELREARAAMKPAGAEEPRS